MNPVDGTHASVSTTPAMTVPSQTSPVATAIAVAAPASAPTPWMPAVQPGTSLVPPAMTGLHQRIGRILMEAGEMTAEQVDETLRHQAAHGGKFGDTAVALGFATPEAVLQGLARQHYVAPAASLGSVDAIPHELVVLRQPFSEAAEIVRDVRSRLVNSTLGPERNPRPALSVVSVDIAEGKTWFACNLAVSLCQFGARVLLIDADLRSPRVHKVFQQPAAMPGLSEVLAGQARLSFACPLQDVMQLFLLPAGAPAENPLELIQGPAFGMLIHQMRQQFDYVLIDTPASLHGADSRVISALAGAALVVVRKHHARSSQLEQFAGLLRSSGTELAGVVLNNPG